MKILKGSESVGYVVDKRNRKRVNVKGINCIECPLLKSSDKNIDCFLLPGINGQDYCPEFGGMLKGDSGKFHVICNCEE